MCAILINCYDWDWGESEKRPKSTHLPHMQLWFDVLGQNGCWKPQSVSLSVFRHCETFFRKFVFSPKGPPFNCDKNFDNFGSVPLLASTGALLGSYFLLFRFSSTVNWHLEVFLLFLSLGYGADLGRSPLVFVSYVGWIFFSAARAGGTWWKRSVFKTLVDDDDPILIAV